MSSPSFRLYRALLQLYPPEFREEYAGPMAHCFRDLSLAAQKKAGQATSWRSGCGCCLILPPA